MTTSAARGGRAIRMPGPSTGPSTGSSTGPSTGSSTGQSTGPSTTTQHALDGLRRAIVAGALRPGQRVAQEDVARQLGVSIAPLREALRTLEQEGQVTYLPRRGYFITALEVADLEEIYALRAILEERAARHALGTLDRDALERVLAAARDCAEAVNRGDVTAEIEANRRFHFAILQSPGQPHTLRLIRLLWDRTEAYRALYYNSEAERRASLRAHERIVKALRRSDADRLVAELADHRERALRVLRGLLGPAAHGNAPRAS
jgi:DNA-binding GntR family transcriptional regulator